MTIGRQTLPALGALAFIGLAFGSVDDNKRSETSGIPEYKPTANPNAASGNVASSTFPKAPPPPPSPTNKPGVGTYPLGRGICRLAAGDVT